MSIEGLLMINPAIPLSTAASAAANAAASSRSHCGCECHTSPWGEIALAFIIVAGICAVAFLWLRNK